VTSIEQKFYAGLKKIYFMGSKVQSKAIRAQKRNLIVMKFVLVVWPIYRSEILCWAQKNILCGVWNATGSHESPKTWNSNKSCNKNLIFSVKKFTFSSCYVELEVFFTIIQQTYSKTCYKFYEKKVDTFYPIFAKKYFIKTLFAYKIWKKKLTIELILARF
jgi:hypothetical protein